MIADLRPGKAASPLIALASALLPLLEPTMTEVDRLRELPTLAGVLADQRLLEVVDRGLERVHADRLLLIVNQFEELFIQEPAVAASFIEVLLQALAAQQARTSPALTIVPTLRADFLGRALEHPALAKALQDDVRVIGRMTREQLRRVVEGPAAGEVAYEPGLVDRILDDVGSEPGNLPLLEFALTLLWEHQVARTLSHAAYEALANRTQTVRLAGHTHGVTDVAFSSDGRTLASASRDSVILWDAATHTRISGYDTEAYTLAISPNGRLLATDDSLGSGIILRSLDMQEWIRHLCGIVGRDLTRKEWDESVPGLGYQAVCR